MPRERARRSPRSASVSLPPSPSLPPSLSPSLSLPLSHTPSLSGGAALEVREDPKVNTTVARIEGADTLAPRALLARFFEAGGDAEAHATREDAQSLLEHVLDQQVPNPPFQSPSFVPQATGFRRVSVQIKDGKNVI